MPDTNNDISTQPAQYSYPKDNNFKPEKYSKVKYNAPINFNLTRSKENLLNLPTNFSGNTSIADRLSRQLICQPDALRVDNTQAKIEAESTYSKTQKTKVPHIPTNYQSTFDVTKNMFNGTAEDLNNRLKGTKLEGKGQMFLDAQEKYGINALFLLSIVKGESGYGSHPAKEPNGTVHKYNIAGLKSGKKSPRYINPSSYEDCIESLCKNLHKHYISKGKTTIGSIAKVYAPGNIKWTPKTTTAMNELAEAIIKDYKNQIIIA